MGFVLTEFKHYNRDKNRNIVNILKIMLFQTKKNNELILNKLGIQFFFYFFF